jgi:hypothetical protein
MKLIKIKEDHYIVVDDSPKGEDFCIPMGTKYLDDTFTVREAITEDIDYWAARKDYYIITHSTQPLESIVTEDSFKNYEYMSIKEVQELIGEVDAEKKAKEEYKDNLHNPFFTAAPMGYVKGYNQALEDNKEKKYTKEDMINAFREGTNAGALHERLCDYDNGDYEDAEQYSEQYEESFIQSLQSKTEWELELVDGKLKIK